MIENLRHAVAGLAARLWLATSTQSWRRLPRPEDTAQVHAVGSDSDRLLLLGSGVAVGYGVVSHDLALGGNLAREVTALTGRGVSIDIVARADMSTTRARDAIASREAYRFDALVLALGGLEAFTLLPPRRWRQQLETLLDEIEVICHANARVFLVQIGMPLLEGLPRSAASLVQQSTVRLNEQTREAAHRRPHVTFVEFAPPQGDLGSLAGRSTYHDWARLIAPAVAADLDGSASRRPTSVDEEARQRAVASMRLSPRAEEELDSIVETARNLFGTAGASVTIIDGDRQNSASTAGMPSGSIPRDDSICTRTIAEPELLVIEDTTTDGSITWQPWGAEEQLRFYAGYPVESPDGQRVGALCVVDTRPRAFTETDAALLRQLALRVQAVLWDRRS
jgi:hypothetical protein